jgi:cytochrome c oxidase subunit II
MSSLRIASSIACAAAIGVAGSLVLHAVITLRRPPGLEIRAVAHEWWWEFDYPSLGITNTNELHVPSGTTIHLQLVSADVIHSLWIPGLSKAIPIIPGSPGGMDFVVKAAGRFYGNCDAGCGCNTVCMRFLVIADSPGHFAAWIKRRHSGALAGHVQHVSAAPACALNPSAMPRHSSPGEGKPLNNNLYSAHGRRNADLLD